MVDDELAQQCAPGPQIGIGKIVLWNYKGSTKPELTLTVHEAIDLYRQLGFLVISAQTDTYIGAAFGQSDLHRRFFSLVIQKPTRPV